MNNQDNSHLADPVNVLRVFTGADLAGTDAPMQEPGVILRQRLGTIFHPSPETAPVLGALVAAYGMMFDRHLEDRDEVAELIEQADVRREMFQEERQSLRGRINQLEAELSQQQKKSQEAEHLRQTVVALTGTNAHLREQVDNLRDKLAEAANPEAEHTDQAQTARPGPMFLGGQIVHTPEGWVVNQQPTATEAVSGKQEAALKEDNRRMRQLIERLRVVNRSMSGEMLSLRVKAHSAYAARDRSTEQESVIETRLKCTTVQLYNTCAVLTQALKKLEAAIGEDAMTDLETLTCVRFGPQCSCNMADVRAMLSVASTKCHDGSTLLSAQVIDTASVIADLEIEETH